MNLRTLFLLTQCICFKTNFGSLELQSKSGENANSEKFQSKIEESAKADFFRDASFSDPKLMKTNSPRKIHIGTSMRIIKVHKVLF